ncbi:hypothetical protein JCM3770_002611 [Rhodotorula araucariae]
MPLQRLTATPGATVDPRLARRRRLEEVRASQSERSTLSIGGSVGPERAASTSSRDPRRSTTPYNRSLSAKPVPTIFPPGMYAEQERDKVYCGACCEYHAEREFRPKQLRDGRRAIARAERAGRKLEARDFPRCARVGLNAQILEIKCTACGAVKEARHAYSAAMRANPLEEQDKFAAYGSSSDEDDDADAAGIGGAGSRADGVPSWDAAEAYRVQRDLTTVAEEGGGERGTEVVYDDDDEW